LKFCLHSPPLRGITVFSISFYIHHQAILYKLRNSEDAVDYKVLYVSISLLPKP
jgi:hypothetical protein